MKRRPWDQLAGEPDRAYALFDEFLGLGPTRSLRKLADTGVASLSHLKQLSARWNWQPRAAAWQAEVARAHRPPTAEDLQTLREQQLQDARMLRGLARAQMQEWIRQSRNGEASLGGQFSSDDLLRMWQTGLKAEAQLRALLTFPETEGETEEDRWWGIDPEECAEPQEAMAQALALAVAFGLPESATSQAQEKLWALAQAVLTCRERVLENLEREGEMPWVIRKQE